jgi:hypothetical protein
MWRRRLALRKVIQGVKQRAAARLAFKGLINSKRAARLNAISSSLDRRSSRRANRLKYGAIKNASRAAAFHRRGALWSRPALFR